MDLTMMASRRAWSLLLLSLSLAGTAAQAQSSGDMAPLDLIKGGGTPAAIGPNALQVIRAQPCPLVVSPQLPALQPLRIAPKDVAAKNRMGCLSPADAIYGADGCPARLCSKTSGVVPLPSGTAAR